MFTRVAPSPAERSTSCPGDDIVPSADVVMDRGFTAPASPELVWPWLRQLGKKRAGWYLPGSVERFLPAGRRAIRRVDARWQQLAVGDVIPDYGPGGTLEVALIDPGRHIVYTAAHKSLTMSWAIMLTPINGSEPTSTRVHLRLRLGPVRRTWLANSVGDWFDLVTIAGMAAGLVERLSKES